MSMTSSAVRAVVIGLAVVADAAHQATKKLRDTSRVLCPVGVDEGHRDVHRNGFDVIVGIGQDRADPLLDHLSDQGRMTIAPSTALFAKATLICGNGITLSSMSFKVRPALARMWPIS